MGWWWWVIVVGSIVGVEGWVYSCSVYCGGRGGGFIVVVSNVDGWGE